MGFNSGFKGLILEGSTFRSDYCSGDAQFFSLILELNLHVIRVDVIMNIFE